MEKSLLLLFFRKEGLPFACLIALPALALALFCAVPPAHGMLTNDSPGYLYFSAGRPAGYPVFLYILRHLTGTYAAVPLIQAALYCAAIAWLGLAARAFARSLAAALVLQAAILLYPPPLQQASQIIADSLSSTIIVLFAAAALRMATSRAPSLAPAWLAAAGVLVRPDNLALCPAAFLLIAIGHGRANAWRALLKTGFFALAAMAATPLAQTLVHGAPDRAQPLSRGLIQKAMFLPPAAAACTGCDADLIDGGSKALIDYWRAAPPQFQDVLRLRISNLLRYSVIIPALAARHHATATRDIEPILLAYTTARIGNAKQEFAAGTAHEYRDLLINYTYVSPAWRAAYIAYLAANPPPMVNILPMPKADADAWRRAAADLHERDDATAQSETEKNATLAPPPSRNPIAATAIDTVQVAASLSAWLLIAGLPFMLRRSGRAPREAIAAAALAVALQLHLIAIATLEIAQPRYTAPLWPLMTTLLFATGALAAAKPPPKLHAGPHGNRR